MGYNHLDTIDGYVYFAKEPDTGLIKIGFTCNVWKRMAQHRRKHPSMILVARIRCTRPGWLEKLLHFQLKKYMAIREWYRNESKVFEISVRFIAKHGEIFGAKIENLEIHTGKEKWIR